MSSDCQLSICHDSELMSKENNELLKLSTDMALMEDDDFYRYVEIYAKVTILILITRLHFIRTMCRHVLDQLRT